MKAARKIIKIEFSSDKNLTERKHKSSESPEKMDISVSLENKTNDKLIKGHYKNRLFSYIEKGKRSGGTQIKEKGKKLENKETYKNPK